MKENNNKTAVTVYPVIDLIRRRWSPRSFSPDPISETDLNTLLEAAGWAFSSGNLQPWFYVYAFRGSVGFDRILSCLDPSNQVWARHSAVLMVSLAKKERDPGKPNHKARHDLGAANMLLALQGLSMGIFIHPMGGYDSGKVSELPGVDVETYEPVACIALGYAGDPTQLDESLQAKETAARLRKPIADISMKLGDDD